MGEQVVVAQVMIQLPGGKPVAGEIAVVAGDSVKLDEIAINTHGLVNDIVMSLRKNKIVKDGQDQD